jgi:hypothetical protein
VNRIAGQLPGAWRLCNFVAISEELFVTSHIPALFLFQAPEISFSMRENAVSDAYGWYDLKLLSSL